MNAAGDFRTAYADAAAATADLVERAAGRDPERWRGPGLGEWDLRGLVGHTSRAMVTVLTYLDRPAGTEDVASPRPTTPWPPPGPARERTRPRSPSGAGTPVRPSAPIPRRRSATWPTGPPPGSRRPTPSSSWRPSPVGSGCARTCRPGPSSSSSTASTSRRRRGCPYAYSAPALVEAVTVLARTGVQLDRGPALLAALTGRATLPPGFTLV